MEWWKGLEKFISLEWLMIIYTAFPFVGKGFVAITTGICKFQFPFWKVVFLCSIGTCIKAGYYFPIIYGMENYLHRKNIWIWRIIKNWIQRKMEKAKDGHGIFLSFFDFRNLGPTQAFFWTMIIMEVPVFIGGTNCLRKILLLLPAICLVYYSYRNREKRWMVYFSLLTIPNINPGILAGACLSYFYKVRFWRGFSIVVFGSIVSTIFLTIIVVYFKSELSIFIFKLESFFFT